jgi:hypothetical protein
MHSYFINLLTAAVMIDNIEVATHNNMLAGGQLYTNALALKLATNQAARLLQLV